jgi:hypothetical protein
MAVRNLKEDKKMTPREKCLTDAGNCVLSDREKDYGSPEYNFEAIADFWNVFLKGKLTADITAEEVGNMMILFKLARRNTGQFKEDTYIDIAGYAACSMECGAIAKYGTADVYDEF